ncbi:hypothetical protein B0H17DRAFT_1133817 [Mycena rosella]|uniref:Uncharacterized protein n=1 Tax=Mycena rosella TaxID=1033263 RepID=A0AAD7DGP3_MYCRO|nr:hypothetical protein B0H17DRAFT_1133817 [Mycena rosella]
MKDDSEDQSVQAGQWRPVGAGLLEDREDARRSSKGRVNAKDVSFASYKTAKPDAGRTHNAHCPPIPDTRSKERGGRKSIFAERSSKWRLGAGFKYALWNTKGVVPVLTSWWVPFVRRRPSGRGAAGTKCKSLVFKSCGIIRPSHRSSTHLRHFVTSLRNGKVPTISGWGIFGEPGVCKGGEDQRVDELWVHTSGINAGYKTKEGKQIHVHNVTATLSSLRTSYFGCFPCGFFFSLQHNFCSLSLHPCIPTPTSLHNSEICNTAAWSTSGLFKLWELFVTAKLKNAIKLTNFRKAKRSDAVMNMLEVEGEMHG